MQTSQTQLKDFFQCLWSVYASLNPQVVAIKQCFENSDERVVNDHVAFRTFDCAPLGIHSLSRAFERFGYTRGGDYVFEEKHLVAVHYEPPIAGLPKCFVSELKTTALSSYAQGLIHQAVAAVPEALFGSDYFCCSGRPWPMPSFQDYTRLRDESEYAAWLLVFGHVPNHFTVRVNDLSGFDSLQAVNEFIEASGFELNASGGKIKGAPAEGLMQSSTMAGKVSLAFDDGCHWVPSVFYEFAHRFVGPDGKLFEGFVTKNADKVFESTDAKPYPGK